MSLCLLLAASFALPQAEFAKYHREITGREPPADAIAFAIDPAVSRSGHDAYVIKSRGTGVDITGSNERSVWYGLYDLLERRGGCHWFWDVDIVPHRESIDLSGLDVREEARFEYRGIRYFAHRGLTRFQAEHWGLLHTGGLGERRCCTNRADNLALKIDCLRKFLKRAHRDYPDAKVLLGGWDFYFTWHPHAHARARGCKRRNYKFL